MRHGLQTALLAAACVTAAPTAWAAPLLSMQYQIDSFSKLVEFMGDGSVRICDGSVLVACDGSVTPSPGVSFRTVGDGSVRELTPFWLLGDGSVRLGNDRPTETDGILLSSLTFSPNPFIAATVSFLDLGSPSSLLVTFFGPLDLGSTQFDFSLEGTATLSDAEGNGVSAGEIFHDGVNGFVFGAVDLVGLAAIGAGDLNGGGDHPLGTSTGGGSCVACANQSVTIGLMAVAEATNLL